MKHCRFRVNGLGFRTHTHTHRFPPETPEKHDTQPGTGRRCLHQYYVNPKLNRFPPETPEKYDTLEALEEKGWTAFLEHIETLGFGSMFKNWSGLSFLEFRA